MFEIGDTVLCKDSAKRPETQEELSQDVPDWVVKGQKYTIRGFTDNDGIVEGVWLEEIVNPVKFFRLLNRISEPAFGLFRFTRTAENQVESEINIKEEVF